MIINVLSLSTNINDCDIAITYSGNPGWLEYTVRNPTSQIKKLNFNDIMFRIEDNYFRGPNYEVVIEPNRNSIFSVSDYMMHPVDNLTLVELLAKEKNLI